MGAKKLKLSHDSYERLRSNSTVGEVIAATQGGWYLLELAKKNLMPLFSIEEVRAMKLSELIEFIKADRMPDGELRTHMLAYRFFSSISIHNEDNGYPILTFEKFLRGKF